MISRTYRYVLTCDRCSTTVSADTDGQEAQTLLARAITKGWAATADCLLLCSYCDATGDLGADRPDYLSGSMPALLTADDGAVRSILVYAPADVEAWEPTAPLTVFSVHPLARMMAQAGNIALYEPEIGRNWTEQPLPPLESWQPYCTYCDVALSYDTTVNYPTYIGADPCGQVCPANPRSNDRHAPHQPIWRIRNDVTGASFPADAIMIGSPNEWVRCRERRDSRLYPPASSAN